MTNEKLYFDEKGFLIKETDGKVLTPNGKPVIDAKIIARKIKKQLDNRKDND